MSRKKYLEDASRTIIAASKKESNYLDIRNASIIEVKNIDNETLVVYAKLDDVKVKYICIYDNFLESWITRCEKIS